MRSSTLMKAGFAGALAALLGGCLISEDPVLNARNGNAKPLAPGDYQSCPVNDDDDEPDCQFMSVTRDRTGLYKFVSSEDQEVTEMRFRRVGRAGYAVQANGADDGYAYYYGAGDTKKFRLVLMMCGDLPDAMRAKLIARGDLETDEDGYTTCAVKTVRGLTDPAKAYHRGQVRPADDAVIELRPAPHGAVAE